MDLLKYINTIVQYYNPNDNEDTNSIYSDEYTDAKEYEDICRHCNKPIIYTYCDDEIMADVVFYTNLFHYLCFDCIQSIKEKTVMDRIKESKKSIKNNLMYCYVCNDMKNKRDISNHVEFRCQDHEHLTNFKHEHLIN